MDLIRRFKFLDQIVPGDHTNSEVFKQLKESPYGIFYITLILIDVLNLTPFVTAYEIDTVFQFLLYQIIPGEHTAVHGIHVNEEIR